MFELSLLSLGTTECWQRRMCELLISHLTLLSHTEVSVELIHEDTDLYTVDSVACTDIMHTL